MDFKGIVGSRYATKKFDGKPVPQEKIDALLDLIRMSASSFGLQPWKIRVVADAKTKESLMEASYNQAQITSCSHLLVLCTRTDTDELVKEWARMLEEGGVPAESVKSSVDMVNGTISRLSKEQLLAWNQKQVYLALGNALNGAKSLGFDSCPMEGFDPVQYAKILKLPANLVPTVLVPVGYAADSPRPKLRFPVKQILA